MIQLKYVEGISSKPTVKPAGWRSTSATRMATLRRDSKRRRKKSSSCPGLNIWLYRFVINPTSSGPTTTTFASAMLVLRGNAHGP